MERDVGGEGRRSKTAVYGDSMVKLNKFRIQLYEGVARSKLPRYLFAGIGAQGTLKYPAQVDLALFVTEV